MSDLHSLHNLQPEEVAALPLGTDRVAQVLDLAVTRAQLRGDISKSYGRHIHYHWQKFERFVARDIRLEALGDIDRCHVDRWVMARLESVSRNSAARELASIRWVFHCFDKHDLLDSDPSRHVDYPRSVAPEHRPMPPDEEVERVVEEGWADRESLFLSLAAYAGLRRSEIARWRWQDADKQFVYVRSKEGAETKNRRQRRIPLAGTLRRRLVADGWPRRTGPVWAHSAQYLGDRMAKWLEALDCPYRLHGFRAWFATRLAREGLSAFEIAQALGHSNLHNVMRYVQMGQNRTADVLAEL